MLVSCHQTWDKPVIYGNVDNFLKRGKYQVSANDDDKWEVHS